MYDIAIIGGGVNGCGIARDAAGRGLSVFLAEKGDLAGGTSSASTKLVHGGLRYLEQYEFHLVRESLIEREILLQMAPHIIWPLRFVLPHHAALRPAWLIRLGLFLYDHLGGRRILPASKGLDLTKDVAGEVLQPSFVRGFEYSDCWVDDARLVVLNAMDARRRGAKILTRTSIVAAKREEGHWRIELESPAGVSRSGVEARVLINAAGPWVDDVLHSAIDSRQRSRMRLVKGSHIVVPSLFRHPKAYIFQNEDRRVIFAIPYENDFTLIGTTDVDYSGDPGGAAISDEEIAYLCRSASVYFREPVIAEAVVWSYSGVRPLVDEGGGAAQETSRDFVLELDGGQDGKAALLNVCGGKITSYRRLAESALDKLKGAVAVGPAWTASAPLPGGDFRFDRVEYMARALQIQAPAIGVDLARRLARTYGALAGEVLGAAETQSDLGVQFGAGLCEREVRYLMEKEWALTADDILWRRTKLGLRIDSVGRARLAAWLEEHAIAFEEARP